MKLVRMNISVPSDIKTKLDALRAQGITASGFIRHLLEREFYRRARPRGRSSANQPIRGRR